MKSPPRPDDYDYWFCKAQGFSLLEIQRLADGLSYFIHEGIYNAAVSLCDVQVLQRHYYRAALAYSVTHAEQAVSFGLQARANPFSNLLLPASLSQDFRQVATQSEKGEQLLHLVEKLLRSKERPSFEELGQSGLSPQDFAGLLKPSDKQQTWDSLTNTQLRHFDPKGFFHVTARFETESQDLESSCCPH